MIANKITQLRKLRKITEKELSAGIGMSMTGFRQAMANDDFKVSVLLQIASYFRVNITYFLSDVNISENQQRTLAAEPDIQVFSCAGCKQKLDLIEQKDALILDLKFTIDSLKSSIIDKDRTIALLRNGV